MIWESFLKRNLPWNLSDWLFPWCCRLYAPQRKKEILKRKSRHGVTVLSEWKRVSSSSYRYRIKREGKSQGMLPWLTTWR